MAKTLSFSQANLLYLGFFFPAGSCNYLFSSYTLSFLPVNPSYFASHTLSARFEGEKKGGVGESNAALSSS